VRILVVEDSVKMAALLRKGLEREGYAVDVAGSGQDAVWMADENEYDVIVLDIILESGESPLDGFAVCRKIRAAGCRTPVLMVTARDAVEDRVRGLDIGADDYLAKPFSLPELLARVRALIRRGPVERPVMVRVGDLSLNPARHEVERGGARIGLTPTEFALLEYLMRERRPRADQEEPDRARLGLHVRRGPAHPQRLRSLAARQNRPPLRPGHAGNCPRHRLSDRRCLAGPGCRLEDG
jgi:two-component system OmpR family response regulator